LWKCSLENNYRGYVRGGLIKDLEAYYILRVKDREPESVMSYKEAKGLIKREFLAQQWQATAITLSLDLG